MQENRVLTDLYTFRHIEGKAKSRLDCELCTGGYEPFENLRNKSGELFCYLTDVPDRFKAYAKRKADKCLSKTNNISSLYVPDPGLPYGYGDIAGTTDAIIFIFKPDFVEIEIFICRGLKACKRNLYQLLCDNQYISQIEFLRSQQKSYHFSNPVKAQNSISYSKLYSGN